jgi:hypothetical protein
MKTGVIVYVVGNGRTENAVDMEKAVERLRIDADMVEIASDEVCDVHDAWRFLRVKGMHLVECVMAEFTGSGELRLTGQKLRLCG